MSAKDPELKKKNWVLLAVLIGFCAVMYTISFIRFGAAVSTQ